MARRSLLVAILLALPLVFACGDDDAGPPGGELGPCVQGRFCEEPLQCTDGICVHPNQLADSGSADDDDGGEGPSTPGTFDDDGGDGDGVDDGMADGPRYDLGVDPGEGGEVYCSPSEEGVCVCGHTADYGPFDQPCSTSTVGGTSKCCASQGWPTYGGCSCWVQSCRRISSETCLCGIGEVDPQDEPVGACTPDGGICCHDGSSCACWTSITTCLEGETPVESCTVEGLGCGEDSTELSACN
jgi:hypothetical protein